MICLDVNVLVYAHREDAPRHAEYRSWLESGLNGDELFGVTSLVLTGFVRVVTHPRIFDPPSPLDVALTFADDIRGHDNCIPWSQASDTGTCSRHSAASAMRAGTW